jgi:hypothetical protein
MFLIERFFPVGYLAVRMAVVQGVSLRNLSKKTGMTALHVAAYYGEEGTYWTRSVVDSNTDPVGSGPFCRIRIRKVHHQIRIRIQLW